MQWTELERYIRGSVIFVVYMSFLGSFSFKQIIGKFEKGFM